LLTLRRLDTVWGRGKAIERSHRRVRVGALGVRDAAELLAEKTPRRRRHKVL